ncbi:hypothetical protein HD597_012180 [Nonomuraea thailandensis]|uniref:Uncharacterized protein n=1 Tax=Nonomuraea thailandensis TaxID=1188745 RepID=A0A9X2GWD5_9ACTN|nr:hypothetical protein [Nonomuraea thailandensis]MCP2365160.1 hypothetical protein [Nonomuraea thailandensis]
MTKLDTLLAGLARERSTGALQVGRSGTIFLSDGRVTYMECAQAPSVERLLAARGLMSEAALRRLPTDGGCERLLAEGPLTQGELQYAVLGGVLDAAFFLLPVSGARPKFRPGERHWLGGQWFFDVPGLVRECARRRTQLAEIWPSADVDTLPVRPLPRLPGHGVTLSRVQWEVIVRADQKATPLELAKQIGRPAYPVLLAVRRLAASGLLAAPDLPQRRKPGERPPHDPQAQAQPLGPPVTGDPTDLALLMRLKKALEELS